MFRSKVTREQHKEIKRTNAIERKTIVSVLLKICEWIDATPDL